MYMASDDTEDPSGYIDSPVSAINESAFVTNDNFEMSIMENSIMDLYCPRANRSPDFKNPTSVSQNQHQLLSVNFEQMQSSHATKGKSKKQEEQDNPKDYDLQPRNIDIPVDLKPEKLTTGVDMKLEKLYIPADVGLEKAPPLVYLELNNLSVLVSIKSEKLVTEDNIGQNELMLPVSVGVVNLVTSSDMEQENTASLDLGELKSTSNICQNESRNFTDF